MTVSLFAGLRIIFTETALEKTAERLFPESKHRSKRIHKKLVKRFGGEFRMRPAIFKIGDTLYAHPVHEAAIRNAAAPYGGHARKRAASAGGRGTRDVWEGGHKAAASEALGIDWATLAEMSEAIPPAYAEYIGRAAIAHLNLARSAA